MTEVPLSEQQRLANNLSAILHKENVSGRPIKLFSDRDDKKVEVIQGRNGTSVRRTYDKKAVDDIQQTGMSFRQAWDGMHSDFWTAGLNIVSSFIAPTSRPDDSIRIISMHLEDARPVSEASTYAKKGLAVALGTLAHSSRVVFPRHEMLRPDMFVKTQNVFGDELIVLTDVDPYLVRRDLMNQDPDFADTITSSYIDQVASLFWNNWCRETERDTVFGSLVAGLAPILDNAGIRVQKSFGDVHLMEQGISPQDLKS